MSYPAAHWQAFGPGTGPGTGTAARFPAAHWRAFAGPIGAPAAPAAFFPAAHFLAFGTTSAAPAPVVATPPPLFIRTDLAYYLFAAGGAVAGGGVNLPGTFLGAVKAALYGDADIKAALPGGIWNRVIAPGRPTPVAKFVNKSSDIHAAGFSFYVQFGSLQITVYATTAKTAREISDLIAFRMTDIALAWTNGHLIYFRPTDPSSPAPPAPGYGGSLITAETRTFDYAYQSSYLPNTG